MGNGHTYPHPVDRQTHNCENITFPQLRWRAVIIEKLEIKPGSESYVHKYGSTNVDTDANVMCERDFR